MNWIVLPIIALVALASSAGPAAADPLTTAIGILVSGGGAAAAWAALGVGALGAAIQQTVLGLALSAVSRLFRKTPPPPGVRRRVDFGGDKPQRVLLGRYAAAGHLIWAGSHGRAGKSPNAYYTEVILLSGLPVEGLTGVQVGGASVELGSVAHPDYGLPVLDYRRSGTDYLWIKFYTGGQTAADPMLLDRYGDDEGFPWMSSMVGRGVTYAIVTTRGNQELWGGQVPQVLFEINGARLYDLRMDSTMGGDGPQRLDDPSTWAFSANPMVAAYTVMTAGLSWDGQHLYGPRWPRHVLPVSNWLAALNACDVTTPGQGGAPEPMYRFGAELDLSMEPRDFLRELLKCAAADSAECEGQILVHVGPAAAPVAHITDVDFSISHQSELDPFKGLEEVFNAASTTFPDPLQGWSMVPAPARYHPEWEAADGGRRSTAMPFPYVPWVSQVQRLEASLLAAQRRQRVHKGVLHHRFGSIAPLDYVAWSSGRNNYAAKLFKVVSAHDYSNGYVEVLLIEEDPDDYDPPLLLPHVPTPAIPYTIPPQAVPGWDVFPHSFLDEANVPRRAGVRIVWDPEGAEDAQGLRWQVRIAGAEGDGDESPIHDLTAGEAFEERIPGTTYQYRARLIAARPTEWTAWVTVSTPGVALTSDDLGEDAGMALFANGLRSANFVTGVTGFRIQHNGNAEFNNLVARGWIIDGAVSDGFRVSAHTDAAMFIGNQMIVAAQDTGPISPDQFWHVAYSGEIRRRAETSYVEAKSGQTVTTRYHTRFVVQIRTFDGSAWSSWSAIYTSPWRSATTFLRYQGVAHYQNDVPDGQIRILCQLSIAGTEGSITTATPSGPNLINYTNARRFGLSARAVAR